MKKEEIEWYEDNWNRGKNRRDSSETSREFKKNSPLWIDWGEKWSHYYGDSRCWKSNRETQYRIKKEKKNKKRKPKDKEYWRFKKPYHSIGWHNDLIFKINAEKRKAILLERERQKKHIDELKKVGHWISFFKYVFYYSYSENRMVFCKTEIKTEVHHG